MKIICQIIAALLSFLCVLKEYAATDFARHEAKLGEVALISKKVVCTHSSWLRVLFPLFYIVFLTFNFTKAGLLLLFSFIFRFGYSGFLFSENLFRVSFLNFFYMLYSPFHPWRDLRDLLL